MNGVDYKVPYSNEFNEDGTVIYENSLKNNEEFIYDMLEGKEKDLTISSKTIEILVEQLGTNLTLIDSEIEKLKIETI